MRKCSGRAAWSLFAAEQFCGDLTASHVNYTGVQKQPTVKYSECFCHSVQAFANTQCMVLLFFQDYGGNKLQVLSLGKQFKRHSNHNNGIFIFKYPNSVVNRVTHTLSCDWQEADKDLA